MTSDARHSDQLPAHTISEVALELLESPLLKRLSGEGVAASGRSTILTGLLAPFLITGNTV
jgi:hypothetical protein